MTEPSSAMMAFAYDPLRVALSVLIAIAASYGAPDLAGRVAAARKGVGVSFPGALVQLILPADRNDNA